MIDTRSIGLTLSPRHSKVIPKRPSVDRDGFPVSEGLALALAAAGEPAPPTVDTAPLLADYLESLQHNTSTGITRYLYVPNISFSHDIPFKSRHCMFFKLVKV